MNRVEVFVYAMVYKGRSKLVEGVVAAFEVYHRACLSFGIDHEEGRYPGIACNLGVVCAESWGYVDDACAVVGRYIITRYHAERTVGALHKAVCVHFKYFLRMLFRIFAKPFGTMFAKFLRGLHPWHQLLIAHTYKLRTFPAAYYLIRHYLVALLVFIKRLLVSSGFEVSRQQGLAEYCCQFFASVGIIGAHGHVVEFRAYAESRVGRKSPWGSGPCQKCRGAPASHFGLGIEYGEDSRGRGVFHVAVAARLIELMRTQTCTGCRRVRLDGISLIEIALVV